MQFKFQRRRIVDDPKWVEKNQWSVADLERLKSDVELWRKGEKDLDPEPAINFLERFDTWREEFREFCCLDHALLTVDIDEDRFRHVMEVTVQRIKEGISPQLYALLVERREDWVKEAEKIGVTVPDMLSKMQGIWSEVSDEQSKEHDDLITRLFAIKEAAARDVFE